MVKTRQRSRFVLVGHLALLAACGSSTIDQSTRQGHALTNESLCFGGKPELFWDEAHSAIMTNPSGRRFIVVEGRVLWQWEGGVEQIDLLAGRREPVGYRAVLKAADSRETFLWSWSQRPDSLGSMLVAIGPREHEKPERTVVDEQDSPGSPRDSSVVLDGDFIYFASESVPGKPGGLFRVPRNGTGLPERLAGTPAGNGIPLVIERPYVYWSQHGALWRRQITPGAPMQQLTFTKESRLPMVLGGGRLYYLDSKSLFSIPVDGSSPTVEHLKDLDVDRDATMLVDRDCLYWNTKATVMRAKLGAAGRTKPEIIVDKATYDGAPIGTDGKHLYWIHEARSRLMRVGRSAAHLR